MTTLLTVDEALRRILERVRPLAPERLPLSSAAGRVLSGDATAVVDLPRFASSAMDGFAVRAADAPGPLRVVASVAAGRPAEASLATGEAMTIATGGVVPTGADAVVAVELATVDGDAVTIPVGVSPGLNVRAAAGDVRAGGLAVPGGLVLTPARLASLAAAGVSEVDVARRPRAVVIATGSELRGLGERLSPGEIYESNGAMLVAALAEAGALVDSARVVADDPAAHRAALGEALAADVVVTSGGVSVGPHDLVRETLRELGVEEVFWGVAMRPGKPLAFGVGPNGLTFGLPGNPVSSLVGFVLFVRPAIRALQGEADPEPRFLPGTIAVELRRNAARDDFLRARSRWDGDSVVLEPVSGQESHMIVRSATADALVHVPRGDGAVAAGSPVRFLPL